MTIHIAFCQRASCAGPQLSGAPSGNELACAFTSFCKEIFQYSLGDKQNVSCISAYSIQMVSSHAHEPPCKPHLTFPYAAAAFQGSVRKACATCGAGA